MTEPHPPRPDSLSEWFSAQELILTGGGFKALQSVALAIVAAGGLGFLVALFAARAGFQRLIQLDSQPIDWDNLNRIFATARHVGQKKVHVLEELLTLFDRLGFDPDFSYTPVARRFEDPEAAQFLDRADFIISAPNSVATRLNVLLYAARKRKTAFNVGFSAGSDRPMSGEVSILRPRQRGLACPACVSLRQGFDASSVPLFHPPLALLAGLTVSLLAAEICNFDGLGDDRPNYYLFDGTVHSVTPYRIEPDPACPVCGVASGSGQAG